MACGITECPVDILYLVLELLAPADWRELCLVNRRFRAVAEPLLYAKIQWSWQILEEPPRIVQFLRTVIQRPRLGANILEIRLEGRSIARAANPKYAYNSSIPWIPVSAPALHGGLEFIERTGDPLSRHLASPIAQRGHRRCCCTAPSTTLKSQVAGSWPCLHTKE